MSMAVSLGVDVGNVWVTWFVAASVPGLICAALAPYLVYRMVPPELKVAALAHELI
jgi:DASS family divalent anion:Na+ symporter